VSRNGDVKLGCSAGDDELGRQMSIEASSEFKAKEGYGTQLENEISTRNEPYAEPII